MNNEFNLKNSQNLYNKISIEIIGNDLKKINDWKDNVPENARIYIPHFRGSNYQTNVDIAKKVIENKLIPIVHIVARNIENATELDEMLGAYNDVGVDEFLFLGGGEDNSIGEFDSVLHMLQTGVVQNHRVKKMGLAGHPEEHPNVSTKWMKQTLIEKLNYIEKNLVGIEPHIATQFCFTFTPYLEFLDWLQKNNIQVTTRLGLAGKVNSVKLMKFAIACGIGQSINFFRKQFSKNMGLVNYSPNELIAELTEKLAQQHYNFPIGLHFYPFGAVKETLTVIAKSQLENS